VPAEKSADSSGFSESEGGLLPGQERFRPGAKTIGVQCAKFEGAKEKGAELFV
jgi:hypothetical protein